MSQALAADRSSQMETIAARCPPPAGCLHWKLSRVMRVKPARPELDAAGDPCAVKGASGGS